MRNGRFLYKAPFQRGDGPEGRGESPAGNDNLYDVFFRGCEKGARQCKSIDFFISSLALSLARDFFFPPAVRTPPRPSIPSPSRK